MTKAIAFFRQGDLSACASSLSSINDVFEQVLARYLDVMNDAKIPRALWMRYAQGFQAWACGEIVDGEYVEYDGLSGNQLLVFQAVDAFLGLESYLSDKDLQRYIPAAQRAFVTSLRTHNLRQDIDSGEDVTLKNEINKMVKTMKVRTILSSLVHVSRRTRNRDSDTPIEDERARI